jgi:hypothetical protein
MIVLKKIGMVNINNHHYELVLSNYKDIKTKQKNITIVVFYNYLVEDK